MKKIVLSYLMFLFCVISTVELRAQELYKADIYKISDGDTVQVYIDGQLHKIRLLDIDCFETSNNKRAKLQATFYKKSIGEVLMTGMESKRILNSLLRSHKNEVYVELTGKDYFQRDLGYLYIKGDEKLNVNKYMLTDGQCVPYLSSNEMKRKLRNK